MPKGPTSARSSPNVRCANRSGHEGFGELFGEIRDSLRLLLNHGGLHLSAADGGTTMPELARWVQVRDVVRGSTPLGLQAKGHRFVGVGQRMADGLLTLARSSWLRGRAMDRWVVTCFPKQEERQTKATPEPPPRGHDVAPGRRSVSGARRQCCRRVGRVGDPRWRYFGRQPDAHASFEFSVRRFHAAVRPTPLTRVTHRLSSRERVLHRTPTSRARALRLDAGSPRMAVNGRALYFLRPLPRRGPPRFCASPADGVPRQGSPVNQLMRFSRTSIAATLAS